MLVLDHHSNRISSAWVARISASIFTISASRIRSISRQYSLARAWTGSRSGALYRCATPHQREEGWHHQWHPQVLPPQSSHYSYQIVFSINFYNPSLLKHKDVAVLFHNSCVLLKLDRQNAGFFVNALTTVWRRWFSIFTFQRFYHPLASFNFHHFRVLTCKSLSAPTG